MTLFCNRARQWLKLTGCLSWRLEDGEGLSAHCVVPLVLALSRMFPIPWHWAVLQISHRGLQWVDILWKDIFDLTHDTLLPSLWPTCFVNLKRHIQWTYCSSSGLIALSIAVSEWCPELWQRVIDVGVFVVGSFDFRCNAVVDFEVVQRLNCDLDSVVVSMVVSVVAWLSCC